MFVVDVKVEEKTKAVEQAVEKASYRNFRHAAASIRKHAMESIKEANKVQGRNKRGRFTSKKSYKASPPGTPPYTRGKRKKLKKGILYQADAFGAIIGPSRRITGTSGVPHEFGGAYKGSKFPQRPFMSPALRANLSRFAGSWRNSVQP